MARIDDYIPPLGLDLADLMRMSAEERNRRLEQFYANCPPTELQDYQARLESSFDQLEEEFRETHDEMREFERGSVEREEAEDALEQLEAFLEELRSTASEVAQERGELFRDFTSGVDVPIGSDAFELDQRTYINTMGGGSPNPFRVAESQNALEGVTSDGTIHGIVIGDANNDMRKTADDIIFAQERAREEALLGKQRVLITTEPGWRWEFDPGRSRPGVTTFKVTDRDGNFSYCTFENTANVLFIFGAGLNADDTETIQDWPPELLKQSYAAGSNRSFHDRLFAEELSPEERLGVLDGYTDLAAGIESVGGLLGTDGPDDDQKVKLQSIIDLFFRTIDDPTFTIDDAYDEIFDLGLDVDTLRYLIILVAVSAQEYFKQFLGPRITYFESLLNPDDDMMALSDTDVALILLLETHAGPGEFGGMTMLENTRYPDLGVETGISELQGRRLTDVLAIYQGFLNDMGEPVPSVVHDLNAVETETAEAGGRSDDNFTPEIHDTLNANAQAYAELFMYHYTQVEVIITDQYGWSRKVTEWRWVRDTGFDAADLAQAYTDLYNRLMEKIDNHEILTAEDISNFIIGAVQGHTMDGNATDNFAMMVIWSLMRDAPGLLNHLLEVNPQFGIEMWSLIDNGGTKVGQPAGIEDQIRAIEAAAEEAEENGREPLLDPADGVRDNGGRSRMDRAKEALGMT